MIVRLNRDWKQYGTGDTLTEQDRPYYTLQFLVRQGWAEDITEHASSLPTMSNTKKEIEQYLDAAGIEYSEYMTKAELLELIES